MESLKLKVLTTADFIKELRNPSGSALHRNEITYLQERSIELAEMDHKVREKGREEGLCCDVYHVVPFLEYEQVVRFTHFVYACKFEGSQLRAQYDREYLSMIRSWDIPAGILALLTLFVRQLGANDFPKTFVLEDRIFGTLRTEDPSLFASLLLMFGPWEAFYEHFTGNPESFGYAEFFAYRDDVAEIYGIEKLKELYEHMKPSFDDREIGWTEKSIIEIEKKLKT